MAFGGGLWIDVLPVEPGAAGGVDNAADAFVPTHEVEQECELRHIPGNLFGLGARRDQPPLAQLQLHPQCPAVLFEDGFFKTFQAIEHGIDPGTRIVEIEVPLGLEINGFVFKASSGAGDDGGINARADCPLLFKALRRWQGAEGVQGALQVGNRRLGLASAGIGRRWIDAVAGRRASRTGFPTATEQTHDGQQHHQHEKHRAHGRSVQDDGKTPCALGSGPLPPIIDV